MVVETPSRGSQRDVSSLGGESGGTVRVWVVLGRVGHPLVRDSALGIGDRARTLLSPLSGVIKRETPLTL